MTILAAIGGEYEQDRVVEVGYDLAKAYDDELVVVHVMLESQFEDIRENDLDNPVVVAGGTGDGLAYPSAKSSSEAYNLEEATDDAATVAQECISRTLSDDPEMVTAEGRVGDPTTEIVAEAQRQDARYIVVGGRKRSPTGKAIFGSISQSVILNSNRPVVAITRNE